MLKFEKKFAYDTDLKINHEKERDLFGKPPNSLVFRHLYFSTSHRIN